MEFNWNALLSEDLFRFLKVREMGSFSRAAEESRIQQSSLSKSVARLENQLGGALFYRRRSGLILTPLGKTVAKTVEPWVLSLAKRRSSSTQSAKSPAGKFILGINATEGNILLPRLLTEITENYPLIDLHVRSGRSGEVTRQVLNHLCDLGVVVNPMRHPDLVIKQIRVEKAYAYASGSARYESKFPVLYNPAMIRIERVMARFKNHKTLAIGDYEWIARIADAGNFIAILPESIVNSTSDRPQRLVPAVAKPLLVARVSLIYRRGLLDSPGGKALVSLIKRDY